MQLPVIKHLAETCTIEQLKAAEEAILNEEQPALTIEGKDGGEQLTHILAALHILTDVKDKGFDLRTAIRNYAGRVRDSIG